jgi:predicted porin
VTLYGVLDYGFGTINHSPSNDPYNSAASPVNPTSAAQLNMGTAANPVVAPRLTSFMGNNTIPSRWGIKGTEDMGAGNKANFVLESNVNVATGSSASSKQNDSVNGGATGNLVGAEGSYTGALFSRQATVGLEGGWGRLDIGRQTTPVADAVGAYDPMRTGFAVSPLGFNGGYGGGGYTNEARWDNSAKYSYNLNANTALTAGYRTTNLTGVGSAGNAYALKAEYNTAGWGAVLAYVADNDAINAGSAYSAGATTAVTSPVNGATVNATSGPALALTIADTRATLLAFRVSQGAFTYKFGYEHIQMQNPSNSGSLVAANIPSLYGIAVGSIQTQPFNTPRVQDIFFVGTNWQVSAPLELSAAYYVRTDSTYGSQTVTQTAGTSTPYSLTQTSKANYLSFMANYSLSKRTALYATANFTKVSGPAWTSNSTTVSTGGTTAAVTSYGTLFTVPNIQSFTVGVRHSF